MADQCQALLPAPIVSTWQIGSESRCGQVRATNQDACYSDQLQDDMGFIVVCDGVGGHPGGAEAAQAAVRYMSTYLSVRLPFASDMLGLLNDAVQDLQDAFEMVKQTGMTTLIVAVWQQDRLFYATLGDGALYVFFPDQMVQRLLTPHHRLDRPATMITAYIGGACRFTPRLGMVVLPDDSLVMVMSDGVSDLLPLRNIQRHLAVYQRYVSRYGATSLCCQLLNAIEFARDRETRAWLHNDNLTLAIMTKRRKNG